MTSPRHRRRSFRASSPPRGFGPAARGFTLVELMVALTGGLFVSIIVFMLARDGARFYQRETRVANATLAGVMGFARLRADVARAGFMSSPNVRRDPALCGDPVGDATWPKELAHMASLRVDTPPAATSALSDNGRDPDRIVLSGSFASVDEFPIWGVTDTGSEYDVALQPRIGPLARMGYLASTKQQELLDSVFGAGRALRIVDPSGKVQYGTIKSTKAGDTPAIVLSRTPLLRFRGSASTVCGLRADQTGYVNVVNFVQYQVASLAGNAAYAPLYTGPGATPWDAGRTELVRQELDVNGNPIAGTEEVVAEYAVDLKFGLTVVSGVLNNSDPSLTTLLPGDAQIKNWAGDTTKITNPTMGPEKVRAVRVRLSVRSRVPDRDTNIDPSTVPDLAPGFYRMGLGKAGGAPFARVRTLQADVSLTNQLGVLW